MKRIITILLCVIAICASLTGCGAKPPVIIQLDGGGISLSESSDKRPVSELQAKLKEVRLENSDKPLFESVTITESKGIFYNSYRFLATVNPQETNTEVTLTVTMPGKPSGVRNGIIEEGKAHFPLSDYSESSELAVEFEENNIGVMIGIIVVLVVIMAAFFIFMKRGSGGGYDSY